MKVRNGQTRLGRFAVSLWIFLGIALQLAWLGVYGSAATRTACSTSMSFWYRSVEGFPCVWRTTESCALRGFHDDIVQIHDDGIASNVTFYCFALVLLGITLILLERRGGLWTRRTTEASVAVVIAGILTSEFALPFTLFLMVVLWIGRECFQSDDRRKMAPATES